MSHQAHWHSLAPRLAKSPVLHRQADGQYLKALLLAEACQLFSLLVQLHLLQASIDASSLLFQISKSNVLA